jgi:hypothetical protein
VTSLHESWCPGCNNQIEARKNLDDKPLAIGEITLCSHCAKPLRYTDGFVLELIDVETLTPAQRAKLLVEIDLFAKSLVGRPVPS